MCETKKWQLIRINECPLSNTNTRGFPEQKDKEGLKETSSSHTEIYHDLCENIFGKFTMLFINSVLIVPLSWCIGTFFSAGIIFGVVGLGLSIYLTYMIFKY